MALIQCSECGKSISDKAVACPGCGCPLEHRTIEPEPQHIQLSKFSKEELWRKAYNIQYKGKKSDLPAAIEAYEYIINEYRNSQEAIYSQKQLDIINKASTSTNTYTPSSTSIMNFDTTTSDCYNIEQSSGSEINTTSKLNKFIPVFIVCIIILSIWYLNKSGTIPSGKATHIKAILYNELPGFNVRNIDMVGEVGFCSKFKATDPNMSSVNGVVRFKDGKVNDSHIPYYIIYSTIEPSDSAIYNTCF